MFNLEKRSSGENLFSLSILQKGQEESREWRAGGMQHQHAPLSPTKMLRLSPFLQVLLLQQAQKLLKRVHTFTSAFSLSHLGFYLIHSPPLPLLLIPDPLQRQLPLRMPWDGPWSWLFGVSCVLHLGKGDPGLRGLVRAKGKCHKEQQSQKG